MLGLKKSLLLFKKISQIKKYITQLKVGFGNCFKERLVGVIRMVFLASVFDLTSMTVLVLPRKFLLRPVEGVS